MTELVVVLDRSGSMASIKKDMEGGFDSFIAKQRELPDPCEVTLVQFDTLGVDTVYAAKPLADVPALLLEPRGGTPLLDAVGQTVAAVEQRKPTGKVMVIVITDGQENSSREWTKGRVKELLTRVQAAGWAVMYLGANVDAFAEAGSMGIATATTSPYHGTAAGSQAMFTAASASAGRYRSGGNAALTDEERRKLETTK